MSEDALPPLLIQHAQRFLVEKLLPKIESAVESLSDSEIWWRANESSNSAGNLLLHLCGNVRQWIIAGLGGATDVRERPLEFSEKGPIPRDQLLAHLRETVAEACAVLDRISPEELASVRRIQVFEVDGVEALMHVVEHFSYHTGQIVFVAKMFRNKDMRFYDL